MSLDRGRRALLGAGAILVAGAAGGLYWREHNGGTAVRDGRHVVTPGVVDTVNSMPYRNFGSTGLKVSEVSFGAWGIGGNSYGPVEREVALNALAKAEEHGCNLVDTAAVYGNSEELLGEFLSGRRDKWLISTKYSGQGAGMTATLENQLKSLRTEAVDFYMIHWAPKKDGAALYEELYALKKAGKARFVGVSLYDADEIDYVLDHASIDGLMVAVSLLDPDPFLARLDRLRASGIAVMARSSLREGFLTGKFKRDQRFTDPNDQRSKLTPEQIAELVDKVERLRFLEQEAGTMVRAAVAYPLSFPEISTVVLGSTSVAQADSNFGSIPGARLTPDALVRIAALQQELGLRIQEGRLKRLWKGLIGG
jgi:aryl-alcohol dehydrogenase-like predicted oxidoreductase